jgi:hypothetical protein
MAGLEQRYYCRATHEAQARSNGRTGAAGAVDESRETFGMEEVEPGKLPGEMGFMVSDVSLACYVVGVQRAMQMNCWPGPILGGQPKTIQSNFTNLQYHFWYRMLEE